MPIAISIETKPEGGDTPKAMTQLSLWVLAQFNRLRHLMQSAGQDSKMPILPLIIAQGSLWRLYLASQESEKRTVSGSQ